MQMQYLPEAIFMTGNLRPITCEWDCHLPGEKCTHDVLPGRSYCANHYVQMYRITTAELADKEAIAAMKRIAKITQGEYIIEEDDDYDTSNSEQA